MLDCIYDELMESKRPMDPITLRDKRVAFDGTQLLCQIAQNSESWLYGCCTPDIFAFVKNCIDNMLSKFKSVTIVFDGMLKDTPLLVEKNDSSYAGFLAAEGNLSSSAFDKLKKLTPFPNEEFVQTLFTKLQTTYADRSNFNIMRAPFFSIAQMAYLAEIKEVDTLIGSIELFCFGIPSILVMNQDKCGFSIVNNNNNVENVLENQYGGDGVLDSTTLLPLRHFHTIREIYREHHEKRDCSVLRLLRSCPVLKLSETQNEPLCVAPLREEMPSNLAFCVYGHKCLLDDVIFLAGGLQPPSVIRTMSHKVLETPQMLFSPDVKEKYAEEFRTTHTFLTPLHQQIVFQAMGREPNIETFSSSGEGEYANVPPINLDEWEVPDDCVKADWVEKLQTLAPKSGKTKYLYEHKAAAITTKLKLLDLMGYFTHATAPSDPSSPSVFCEALLENAKQDTAKTAVLFIEACRTKTLEWETKNDEAANKATALRIFATQVLSMFPLRVKEEPLKLKTISVPVFRFNMRLRSVFMALRELNMVLARRTTTKDSPTEFVREATIFDEPPSPLMGYVAQEIFGSKPVKTVEQLLEGVPTLEQLQEKFPTAIHLKDDLLAARDGLKMLCKIADKLARPEQDANNDDEPPFTVLSPMRETHDIFVKALEKVTSNSMGNAKGMGKYKR